MSIKNIFTPDYTKYEGVRPINIYLLRLVYFLMLAFVASDAWTTILKHQGAWDPTRAVAWCVWASYPTLSFFGLIHPLKMLPLMIFAIMYKVLWLIVVAYPLWRAGALAGSPASGLANTFLWVPLPIIAVPWKYVFQNYVMWSRKKLAA
jgi:hypothetical protein